MPNPKPKPKPKRRTAPSRRHGGGATTPAPGTAPLPELPVPPPPRDGLGAGPGRVVINTARPVFADAPFAVGADAPGAIGAEGARTVIYVHGIGNMPVASVLKCQWDTALFGHPMGDRTRLADWVDRTLHAAPVDATCGLPAPLRAPVPGLDAASDMAAIDAAPRALARDIAALAARDTTRRAVLAAIAAGMARAPAEPASGGLGARGLELAALRRAAIAALTRTFLRDAHAFLFLPARRDAMAQSLMDRLAAGGGPFVVVAHSQGAMIAYEVLRRLDPARFAVTLFLTLGAPLGLGAVQERLRAWDEGRLRFPACVQRWVNIADRLDPVALDATLDGEFAGGRIEDIAIRNPAGPVEAHSGIGYLGSAAARAAVRAATGGGFAQRIAPFAIAGDLVGPLEDGGRETRHPVLIQLAGEDGLAATGAQVAQRIHDMLASQGLAPEDAALDRLHRFLAARLTRLEIEALRAAFRTLAIGGIWRNARKHALIADSAQTVQARPANLAYGADGRGICWAVLDTGIRADHPHFAAHANVIAQYDCTRPGAPRRRAPGDSDFAAFDANGHGTHVAGIIAGALEVADAQEGRILQAGMAPRCKLLGFKVLGDDGGGEDSSIIKALDTIAELNARAGQLVVHGVNLSLGGAFDPSVYGTGHTPLCDELRRLWRQGVLVCLAAGNEGYAMLRGQDGPVSANMDLSIGDPANLDEAIAVGSVHKTNPHGYGISYFSSRGPTADGRRKPDLVAPGERILSARHDFRAAATAPGVAPPRDGLYAEMSGTSMAAPHVSGVLAAFLSLRRAFIGDPDRVKQILLEACVDLRRDPYMQGAGLPNLIKMLALH